MRKKAEITTINQALYWAVRKWKFVSKKSYPFVSRAEEELIEEIPQLEYINFHCGLCEFQNPGELNEINPDICSTCILKIETGKSCDQEGSLYYNWVYRSKNSFYAKRMLKTLQAIRKKYQPKEIARRKREKKYGIKGEYKRRVCWISYEDFLGGNEKLIIVFKDDSIKVVNRKDVLIKER